jgi:hypothetical protein
MPSSVRSPALLPSRAHCCSAGTTTGGLRYIGRTTSLARASTAALAEALAPAAGEHPWMGRTFTAGWGSRDVLDVTLVAPELVVEVAVDVARDAVGRWRHPIRLHRPRPDVPSGAVTRFGD